MIKKTTVIAGILICLVFNNFTVFAYGSDTKYPDYAYEFLGPDKFERINRKIFNFNSGLNKYAIRPVHTLWASIMPEYGMDRLRGLTDNIEYPIRLVSSLLQKDFETSRNETVRFFTNTVLGLGGMFDPAKHLFKLEQSSENMEQALAGCKLKPGPYFVAPVLSFTSVRGLLGKLFDTALNPGSYIATPVLAIVKAGLTINKTSYMQPLIKTIESTFADPYETAKKIYGIETFIKCANLDRIKFKTDLYIPAEQVQEDTRKEPVIEVKKTSPEKTSENNEIIVKTEVTSELLIPDLLYGGTNIDETVPENKTAENFKLEPDIRLHGYNPQNPVVDSMRTALFNIPGINGSIWNELSIWNRSFGKKIKTSSVKLTEGRPDYKFGYILQKNYKTAPVAIIYPSIGEGVTSSHSVLWAKIFYDKGYSVIIQGSHFQWEFVKSMPKDYRPGIPSKDAANLRILTGKILKKLSDEYKCEFKDKTILGTSFGALAALFVAEKEARNNTLGNTKYISICPPIELIYAMKQIDKNSEEWNNSSEDFKQNIAQTAAKVIKLYNTRNEIKTEINNLPFSEREGKLITGFLMHQKLSDLIYTIENNGTKTPNNDIYKMINNMNYADYAKKYLLSEEGENIEDLNYETSLHSICEYLAGNENYRIYHSLNDYLTTPEQLKKLKQYTGNRTVLTDNGAHLGFIYRDEFIRDLKNMITLN